MKKIAVVGAGLVGSMLSEYLAKRGYIVEVYERRSDLRNVEIVGGRSINLALSTRGWKALDGIELEEKVRDIALPMKGRMMHAIDGELTFQQYGKSDQAIYSVSRGLLNQIMLNAADENDHVAMFFDRKCLDVDLKTNTIKFEHTVTGEIEDRKFDHIFGTDGAFSAIRARLQKTDRFNYSQFYLKHGYKELTIPPNEAGSHKIDKGALHIWPRGEYMLIALPNLDGSFTVTLFFPFEGPVSFSSLTDDEKVIEFFNDQFPDALELMPELVQDW
ncbi:MAG: FAD-dependent monooxygenase, partial [Flavobacteriales bacterium]|nr:FAD-dependent monooxygenase [Flavobacteriales bacterium]